MCVRFCYTGTIDIDFTDDDNDILTHVHLFAHQYNLKPLASFCEHRLTQLTTTELTASNCSGLFCYLLEHEFPSLPNALQLVKAFMCKEFVDVSKSNGFLRLPEMVLCQLLNDASLSVATEDDVLDACCRWLAGAPNTTAGYAVSQVERADRVMQLARFPMLSADKLLEFMSHPMVSQSETLLRRCQFALRWVVTKQVRCNQELLRAKLREENKTEILTPRMPPLLNVRSQILNEEMRTTLVCMLGGPRNARLLVDSSSGMGPDLFDRAVTDQGPSLTIIKSSTGHVFGGYVEDALGGGEGWIQGSPNNFLFSLKVIAPQQVVKLKRCTAERGIYTRGGGLRVGKLKQEGLVAFCGHQTADDPTFELAPGYEAVGSKTLHGQFGQYTPVFMEVFGLSVP